MRRMLVAATVFLFIQMIPHKAPSQNVSNVSAESSTNVSSEQFRSVIDGLEQTDSNINVQIAQLENSLQEMRFDFRDFQEDFNELQDVLAQAKTLESRIAGLEEKVVAVEKLAGQAQSAADSVRWIVAVASVLISGLVVAIGALFSGRFTDLKAEARVAHEIMKRLERRLESGAAREDA